MLNSLFTSFLYPTSSFLQRYLALSAMYACPTVKLYKECCAFHRVKANKEIIRQLDQSNIFFIEEIDASRTFLGEFGVKALLDYVACNTGIRRLILKKNGLGTSSIECLCRLLRSSPYITHVDISENHINVHSARLLWETVRAVSTIRWVNVEHCGLDEEWPRRLQQSCKANEELQELGFYPFVTLRCLYSWDFVLIALIGSPSLVDKFSKEIIPPVGSLLAQHKLRISLLQIHERDSPDVVDAKIRRCRDAHNHGLSWCVALTDGSVPWSEAAVHALKVVSQQNRPDPGPLRNKLGVMRSPATRCTINFFVYDLSSLREECKEKSGEQKLFPGLVEVPPSEWFPSEAKGVLEGPTIPAAVRVGNEECWSVRCQSDLCWALRAVYSGKASAENRKDESLKEGEGEAYILDEQQMCMFSTYPACDALERHVESRAHSSSVPIILHGTDKRGHVNVLRWLASKYAASECMKVVFYPDEDNNRSIVVFLNRLLQVFEPTAKGGYVSLDMLCLTVHDAISEYKGDKMLLVIPSIDSLDNCGSQYCCSLGWLPAFLPSSVVVVVSLDPESPLLATLRKRLPQPLEVVNVPLPEETRSWIFTQELLRRSIAGGFPEFPVEDDGDTTDCDVWRRMVGGEYVLKEGSVALEFATYMASLLGFFSSDIAAKGICSVFPGKVPNTVSETLIAILRLYEKYHDVQAVRHVVTCLTIAALPTTEVVYVCEDLCSCPRNKTMPVLLTLVDDGLVVLRNGSIAHLAGPEVHDVVRSLYADMLDMVYATVETHLYRLIETYSADITLYFRQLGPLMMVNGSFDKAYDLILNPTLMDVIFSQEKENTLYAMDIIFRLLNSYELLTEIHDGECYVMDTQEQNRRRLALLYALRDIQSYDSFFFQSVLRRPDLSPYYTKAVKVQEVPYTVLVPLNTATYDNASATIEFPQAPVFLHLQGGNFVVSTKSEVVVYSKGDLSTPIARSGASFELKGNILGALSVVGSRIVVIFSSQIFLWDFSGGIFTPFNKLTATLSERILDPLGVSLVAFGGTSDRVSILELSNKSKVNHLPPLGAPVREAYFFGYAILVLALYDIHIVKRDEITRLSHTGVVRCVTFPSDGHLIASSVNEDVWIWSGIGELLHVVSCGRSPIEELCFNTSGTDLLSRQHEGLKLWDAVSGSFRKLEHPFDDLPSASCFTGDDSLIIALCGRYVVGWDAATCHAVGVLTCGTGVPTFIQKHSRYIMAITSRNAVKVWRPGDDPFLSPKILQKKLSSAWRVSGKLSPTPIRFLTTNAEGTHFALVNSANTLTVQPTNGDASIECPAKEIHSAGFLCGSLLFSYRGRGTCFGLLRLGNEGTAFDEVLLPGDATQEASLEFVSDTSGKFLAVISNHETMCKIYVYEASTLSLLNQFVGHYGRIFFGFFIEDIFISVSEDRTVRCWSISNHAERTAYNHPCSVATATRDTKSNSPSFYLIDEHFSLFYVHLANHEKSDCAHFRAHQLSASSPPGARRAVQSAYIPDMIVVADDGGSVYLIDLHHGEVVGKLADYKCLCISAFSNNSTTFVLTGHTTGEVTLNEVRRSL
uniref:Guanine nucleotide-binding protein subunit beta-like protein n=1 Tax=Trypanosoma congolense (strain IL3000) TaxID=1068625 RepID=G0UNA1_TRYCI|nr:conserved hypothetical protein [Trypanosoma congolense IL3000]